jgi:hypothetical protein
MANPRLLPFRKVPVASILSLPVLFVKALKAQTAPADVAILLAVVLDKVCRSVILVATKFDVIKPARFMVSQLPEAIGACALLEDWGFANRLFGAQMGCYDTSLAQWLQESTRNHSEFDRIVSFE